jgi:peptidoglycan/xylan/chitin deacetylase (PgdA/CDA1 family)
MRFDRILTLGFFKPLRRKAVSGRQQCLPVLMYHSISDTTESDTPEYYRVCTSPARFAEHMAILAREGRRGVSLKEGLQALEDPSGMGEQLVAITFDDGFRDFYTAAHPILKEHGFKATMYLPTAFIGDSSQTFKGRPCMTWMEIKELHLQGIEFGSHTVTHPVLHGLAFSEIEKELEDSRNQIEERLESECDAFAYPYAYPEADCSFTRKFSGLLKKLGYTSAVTTKIGRVRTEDDPLCLKRLPVNDSDDRSLIEAKLQGAYDWLAIPQTASKRARHWIGSRRSHPSEGAQADIKL